MKKAYATVCSIGLVIAALGFLQLGDLMVYSYGNHAFAWAPTIIGIGACVYAFGRTWMIAGRKYAEHGGPQHSREMERVRAGEA